MRCAGISCHPKRDATGLYRLMRPAGERTEHRHGPKPVTVAGLTRDYEAFFRRVFPKAVGVAWRISGDRPSAEDAALEALAKAHFRWRKLGAAPWGEAWVMRVTVNEAIRRLPHPRQLAQPPTTSDPTDAVVLRQTLSAALQSLPQRQREVIVLRYLVGLSEPEVATALGLSLGTVKTHLRRALSGLRRTLGPSLKEEYIDHLV
jgi:RNA polymerase sigma factor (sigma-70 family)